MTALLILAVLGFGLLVGFAVLVAALKLVFLLVLLPLRLLFHLIALPFRLAFFLLMIPVCLLAVVFGALAAVPLLPLVVVALLVYLLMRRAPSARTVA